MSGASPAPLIGRLKGQLGTLRTCLLSISHLFSSLLSLLLYTLLAFISLSHCAASMKRLLRFKRRKASSGDTQGNSAITPPPPVGPDIATPSTSPIPASSLSLPATGPSVATTSPSPTTVNAAQLQTGQAVVSLSPPAGSSPTLSISPSHDIGTWHRAYEIAEDREPELMTYYASHLASLQVHPTSKKDISNAEFVEDVVKQLLEDREKKQWRLSLLGKKYHHPKASRETSKGSLMV